MPADGAAMNGSRSARAPGAAGAAPAPPMADVERMSVSELRRVAAQEGADVSACFEKRDLVDAVRKSREQRMEEELPLDGETVATFAGLIGGECELRTLCSIAAMLAEQRRSREVAAALRERVEGTDGDAAQQRRAWLAVDAVLHTVPKPYCRRLGPGLAGMVGGHLPVSPGCHVEHRDMLGRWWRIFDTEVMRGIIAAFPSGDKPPPPSDVKARIRREEDQEKQVRKRRRLEAEEKHGLGNKAVDDGECERALSLFEEARRLWRASGTEEDPQLSVSRCEAHLKLKRHADALVDAGDRLLRDPNDWEGWELKGLSLRGLGRWAEAEHAFDEALQHKPGKRDTQRIKKRLREVRNDSLAQQDPSKAIAEFRKKGNEAYVADDFKQAEYFYGKLIQLDAGNRHVHTSNRSAARSRLKYFDEAFVDAEQVVAMKPEWVKGWLRKGLALLGLRRFDEAVVALERALKIEPWNFIAQGLHDKAVERAAKSEVRK